MNYSSGEFSYCLHALQLMLVQIIQILGKVCLDAFLPLLLQILNINHKWNDFPKY